MKFLMLVCWDAKKMDAQTEPDPSNPPKEESFPWLDDLQARGSWITAIVTDGPFVETKEAVGGFDLIECGSLGEAVEIAAKHPVARTGTIEVRPLPSGQRWVSSPRRRSRGRIDIRSRARSRCTAACANRLAASREEHARASRQPCSR
jgi:hypothetical protein